jgi:hypothetical protein
MCGGLNDHIKTVSPKETNEQLLQRKLKKQKNLIREYKDANELLSTFYQNEHDMRRIAEAKVIALVTRN